MKITRSKTKDLMATLKVEVVEKDYRENVDKIWEKICGSLRWQYIPSI